MKNKLKTEEPIPPPAPNVPPCRVEYVGFTQCEVFAVHVLFCFVGFVIGILIGMEVCS